MNCRFCANKLTHQFIDLVNSPPSNAFLRREQLQDPEVYYPLKIFVCDRCFLVQVDEYKKAGEIFNHEYAYFSSYSSTWLRHCKAYAEKMMERLPLTNSSLVVEVASNDGYLLQYFKEKNVPVLGVEPSANTAEEARRKGIETIVDFFGRGLAEQLSQTNRKADLLLGNNVLAHVPDINDFVAGMRCALKANGVITMEFPHLMQLIEHGQFDTIYHEHYSYLSFCTVQRIFAEHGLVLFDVEELPTHGGSLRIYGRHLEDTAKSVSPTVVNLLAKEKKAGMHELKHYLYFQEKANKIKYDLLEFVIQQKRTGKKVAAYGAAAKGNTLLNYCGIKNDLIEFVVDASPFKQGKYCPGSHIPVVSEAEITVRKPDFIVILPWNIRTEIEKQIGYIRAWGGKFVIPVPRLEIV